MSAPHPARKNRLKRELENLTQDPPPGIVLKLSLRKPPSSLLATNSASEESAASIDPLEELSNACPLKLHAVISGTSGTPYEDGRFVVELNISSTYPFEPPSTRFITYIYHPNVDEDGRICLDSLKLPPNGAWRPSLNLRQLLSQLRLLLEEPGLSDPLRSDVADLYQSDPERFKRNAREATRVHAAAGAALGRAGRGPSGGQPAHVDADRDEASAANAKRVRRLEDEDEEE